MMDESIAKLNIEHYKKLLTFESDAAKRESVTRLLAAEEATLAKIVKERKRLDLALFDPLAPMGGAHVDPLL